jgi:small GTP-binding protein
MRYPRKTQTTPASESGRSKPPDRLKKRVRLKNWERDLSFEKLIGGFFPIQKVTMEVRDKPNLKCVLLGNSGVGKTSLVMRWTTGDFDTQITPTIGVNHQRRTITCSGDSVDVYLWDTAGQEQFQSLTPLYAHSAATAIIVAAIDDPESFKSLNNWLDVLGRSCDRIPPVILVVNKMDLSTGTELPIPAIEDEYGPLFKSVFYASATTGQSVDAAFTCAGELGYQFEIQAESSHKRPLIPSPARQNTGCC